MATVFKRLVIDASVASAAGLAMKPDSRRCREFLQAALQISHRATMTPLLRAEWNRHQSLFAARWLTEMTSKAKVEAIADVRNEELPAETPDTASAQKDLHLIEAALATDKIVISLDDRARMELAVHAAAEVMWVHQVDEGGHVIYWLRNGPLQLRNGRWATGNKKGPDLSGPFCMNPKLTASPLGAPRILLLLLGRRFLRGLLRSFLCCVLHRLILPNIKFAI
jgi:hypothetical protein